MPLVSLKIKNCVLGHGVDHDLFNALARPTNLRHFEIEMCTMEDDPYQQLISVLPHNESLMTILLRKTSCTLAKLIRLLEVISHHKRLQTLNLPNVTHDIKSEAQILELKRAIAGMYSCNPKC